MFLKFIPNAFEPADKNYWIENWVQNERNVDHFVHVESSFYAQKLFDRWKHC